MIYFSSESSSSHSSSSLFFLLLYAVKNYDHDKGTPTIGNDDDAGDDLSSPLPQCRNPSDADNEKEVEDDDDEDDDDNEFGDLYTVQIDNEYEEGTNSPRR